MDIGLRWPLGLSFVECWVVAFCSTAPKKKVVELVIPLQKPNAYAKPKPKPAVENGDGPAVTPTEGGDAAASGAGAAKPGDDGKLDVELSLEERAIKALNDSQSLHWRLDRF